MNDKRTKLNKHLDSPPYPEITDEIRLSMDKFLEYWEGVALATVKRMQRARGTSREPHMLAHIKYWKHALAAYRWARKRNLWSVDVNGVGNQHSTESTNPPI